MSADIAAAIEAATQRRLLDVHARRVSQHAGAADVLDQLVCQAIDRAWTIGWQPRDLVRIARRNCPVGERPVVVAISAESRTYVDDDRADARWLRQLDEIGAIGDSGPRHVRMVDPRAADLVREVSAALTVLAWLTRLIPLPGAPEGRRGWERDLVAGPGGADRDASDSLDAVVAKVRALLAKAESTDFPAEAETFSAKAQELITRHAIDRALLDAGASSTPVLRRVHLDDPYPEAKAQLLAAVASANRCQAVWSSGFGFSTVIGFASDVDSVELLHASLLVQATRAMAAIGRTAPSGSRLRGAAFRRSFLVGFATQIGERLREAAEAETANATERHGGSLVPVLAKRDEAVDRERDRVFPRLQSMTRRVSDAAGWQAGRAAGQAASLTLDHEVVPHLSTNGTRA